MVKFLLGLILGVVLITVIAGQHTEIKIGDALKSKPLHFAKSLI